MEVLNNIEQHKKYQMKKIFIVLAALVPFISFAHDGHGSTGGFTIIHYFVEPQHLITTIVITYVLYLFYKGVMQKENKA